MMVPVNKGTLVELPEKLWDRLDTLALTTPYAVDDYIRASIIWATGLNGLKERKVENLDNSLFNKVLYWSEKTGISPAHVLQIFILEFLERRNQ